MYDSNFYQLLLVFIRILMNLNTNHTYNDDWHELVYIQDTFTVNRSMRGQPSVTHSQQSSTRKSLNGQYVKLNGRKILQVECGLIIQLN
jgi:hypothetical protein